MTTTFEIDAGDYVCPFNKFEPCRGAKCMLWTWHGRSEDTCETDNLQETPDGLRPIGDPKMPEGDGWEMDGPSRVKGYHRSEKDKLPKATSQSWRRPIPRSRGTCGQAGSEGGMW